MPNTSATSHRRDSPDLLDYARSQARLARICRDAGRHDEANAIIRSAQATADAFVEFGTWYGGAVR